MHANVGLIDHLSDSLQLLQLDPRGPEPDSISSELEERLNSQFCGNSTR